MSYKIKAEKIITAAAEMASDKAGIWKKILATPASKTTIMPMKRNFPILLKSRLLTVATVAIVKKIAPVPPAAMAIIDVPFEKPSATCKIRDSIRPMKKVKPSSNATPSPLSLFFSMPYMKPQAMPRNRIKLMNGLPAMKLKFICTPTNAPKTVGIMEKASKM